MLSCGRNRGLSWLIYADNEYNGVLPINVVVRQISWSGFKERASDALKIRIDVSTTYSVCNLRPMFGVIFRDEIMGYDFFGWCDLDIIWGDILSIYNDDVFEANVVSSDATITSGHFLLLKNEPWLRDAYLLIDGWRQTLANNSPCEWRDSLDEAKLSQIFSPDRRFRRRAGAEAIPPRYFDNNFFRQQYATPFTPQRWHDGRLDHPEVWFWRNGRIFNERDRERQFLYLHLMNFRAQRWINVDLYASSSTWDSLGNAACFRFDADATEFRISRQGVWPQGEACSD